MTSSASASGFQTRSRSPTVGWIGCLGIGSGATSGRGLFLRLPVPRLKEKGGKIEVVPVAASGHFGGRAMNFPDFLRIEREQRDGSRHYVVHTNEPKFSLELAPDGSAPDRIGGGVIKRLHVPNSWAGDYTRYSKYITAAQEFFHESFAEPAPKGETRRLAR